MILALDGTAVAVAGIAGAVTLGGAWIAIVPQLKKLNEKAREEFVAGEQRVTEKVAGVEAHLKNGLSKALIRLESMVADIRATQEVSSHLDERPMFRTTPHGGLTWANEAAVQLLGMSLPELQEDGWARAVHPEDSTMVFQSWKKSVRECKPFGPMFYRYLHPHTRKITWVKAVAQPIINHSLDELEGWVAVVIVVEGPPDYEEEAHA